MSDVMQVFNEGMKTFAPGWLVWMRVLAFVNVVPPVLFITRLEAQLTLGAAVVASVCVLTLTHLQGFTRLLGLGHIVWVPLVMFLWSRLGQIPSTSVFGMWVRVLIVINCLSLALDVTDVVKFNLGDRLYS